MQPFRRGAALLASLTVLTLPLAGCHHADTEGGHIQLNNSTPIATVNGQDITQEQFFTQLQNYLPQQGAPAQTAGNAVLSQMINSLLVEQYAQAQGVAPTDAQVDALYGTFQAVRSAQSVKPFDALLAESGQTPGDIKDTQLRPQLAQINLLAKGLPPVTDAEVSAYYDQNKAQQYTESDRAHIKRIVLSNAADAQRIYGQIQKGQSFDSFTSQSLDRQFPDGDVSIWVDLDAATSPLVPGGMLNQIKTAKAGAVLPPFPFNHLYWLVQVVERKDKEVVPLDQVKESIRFALMEKKAGADPSHLQQIQQQLRDFRAKAKITIPDKRYSQLLAELTAPPPPQPTFAPPSLGAPPGGAPQAPAAKH